MFYRTVDPEIKLSLLHPHYADDLFKLIDIDREYLSQWLSWPAHTKTASDCESFAKQMLHSYADGKSMACCVHYQGTLVGTAGFNVIDHSLKRVEIGYWLASAYQGKGIVTRTCQKLIQIAFEELAIEKVQIAAAEDNLASRAVCERLGLSLEGIIKNSENLNGRIVNHAVYGKRNDALAD